MSHHSIGDVEDFPNKKGVKVDVNGIEIAVFKYDEEFYAIQNRCPHKSLPLHLVGHDRKSSEELMEESAKCPKAEEEMRGGFNIGEDSSILCPWHSLEWDLESGRNEIKDMHIATYDVEVSDQGEVLIEI